MLVVVLALVAAVLSAISAAGEHRAAARSVSSPHHQPRSAMARALAFARALLSSPLWVICWTVDVVSFFVQAAALHLGTLSLVEPMMVSTLLFTLPLAAVESRRWPSVRDWAGTVAVSVGLALVLLTRPVTEATTRPTALLLPALGLFLGVAVALLAAATGRGIAVKAMAASVAAGILFGMGAATMKLAAARLVDAGPVGLLTSWPGYALALVTLASFALQQGAYAVGPLAEVMTAVIVIDPLVSYLLGVVGFGEPWPRPGVPLAVTLSGALVLVLGVATLVRSPLLRPAGAPAAVDPDRGRLRRREDEAGHRQQAGAS